MFIYFLLESRCRRLGTAPSWNLYRMVRLWCNLIMLFGVRQNSHGNPQQGHFIQKFKIFGQCMCLIVFLKARSQRDTAL